MADPSPYATNEYLVKQLNKFKLAYLHMVEPRANGATDTEGSHQDQDLTPFRQLFKGTFMAAGELLADSDPAVCVYVHACKSTGLCLGVRC